MCKYIGNDNTTADIYFRFILPMCSATNRMLQDVVDWLACSAVVYVWWDNFVFD